MFNSNVTRAIGVELSGMRVRIACDLTQLYHAHNGQGSAPSRIEFFEGDFLQMVISLLHAYVFVTLTLPQQPNHNPNSNTNPNP